MKVFVSLLLLIGIYFYVYGIRSIPQPLLVNAEGIVVWKGHPSTLTVSFIEEKLK